MCTVRMIDDRNNQELVNMLGKKTVDKLTKANGMQ